MSCGSGKATGSSRSSRLERKLGPGARAFPDRAAYTYEKTGPRMGTVSLTYDDGASCELGLSFTEDGSRHVQSMTAARGTPEEGSFRLTTGSLFVPVILSSAGRNQSFFTSELTLTNRGDQDVRLDYTYLANRGEGKRNSFGSDLECRHDRRSRLTPWAI